MLLGAQRLLTCSSYHPNIWHLHLLITLDSFRSVVLIVLLTIQHQLLWTDSDTADRRRCAFLTKRDLATKQRCIIPVPTGDGEPSISVAFSHGWKEGDHRGSAIIESRFYWVSEPFWSGTADTMIVHHTYVFGKSFWTLVNYVSNF